MSGIPIISFCISTYNRSQKVLKLVNEILDCESKEIEVIVSDNCSTDNTKIELLKIHDNRFKFLENATNLGAIQNYVKVISAGTGKYIFFCTDKDSILTSGIDDLIQSFINNPDIIAGYCTLDLCKREDPNFFEKGANALKNIGYLSRHPSGYFFQKRLLDDLNITENYTDFQKVGPFPFEFILAEFCLLGKTAIINLPLCYIEKMEDVKSIRSYSYSWKDNNLYFLPSNRYFMLERYINHIKTLDLLSSEKRQIIERVFSYGLSNATIVYKEMVENYVVCDHYNMTPHKVGLFELLKIDFIFNKNFIFTNNFSNIIIRIYICFVVHMQLIRKIFVLLLSKTISIFKS